MGKKKHGATHEFPQKFQLNQSSRLAGYTQHIYIYPNFFFYYIDYPKQLTL